MRSDSCHLNFLDVVFPRKIVNQCLPFCVVSCETRLRSKRPTIYVHVITFDECLVSGNVATSQTNANHAKGNSIRASEFHFVENRKTNVAQQKPLGRKLRSIVPDLLHAIRSLLYTATNQLLMNVSFLSFEGVPCLEGLYHRDLR